MFSRITATLQAYPQKFQEIYLKSKTFSEQRGLNMDEVFDQAVKFHDPQYSLDHIQQHLENHPFQAFLVAIPDPSDASYDVWLLTGETGQGKSTFVNVLSGLQQAVEGFGINSMTQEISLYLAERFKVILIDTPGFFDTGRRKNRDIASQIIDIVQQKLRQNARINGIFLVWNPNYSRKFRLDEILQTLRNALGEEAIHSLIFLVNRVSHQWNKEYENLYEEFLDMLDNKGMNNPVYQVDLKQMNQGDVEILKGLTKEVRPFKEEDFEIHRIMVYYRKFLDVQRADEERRRERMEIEEHKANEMEEQFRQQQEQREAEYTENRRRLEEEHKEELARQREENTRLLREEQEKAQRIEQKRKEEKSKDNGINFSGIVNAGLPILVSIISQLIAARSQSTPSQNAPINPPIIPSNVPQTLPNQENLPGPWGGPGRERENPFAPRRRRETENSTDQGGVNTPFGLGLDNPFGQGGINNPFGSGGAENPFGQGGMNNPFGSGRIDRPNGRQPGMNGFLDRRGVNNRGCFGPPGGP